MDGGTRDLLARVAGLADELPGNQLDPVCRALLESETQRRAITSHGLATRLGSPAARTRLANLLTDWTAAGHSPAALCWALRGAQASRAHQVRKQSMSLVWTGPAPHHSTLRRTDQVLQQLIEEASRSILIVTFAAYKVPRIKAALEAKLAQGVEITLVLESKEQSQGAVSFGPLQALGPVLAERAAVYTWPRDERPKDAQGKPAAMHAKCAVVDGAAALISSANLTGYALRKNMELGVVVRGGRVPGEISKHIDHLIEDGILVRMGLAAPCVDG